MGCKVHLAVTPVISAPGPMIFDGAAQGGFWRDFLFAAFAAFAARLRHLSVEATQG